MSLLFEADDRLSARDGDFAIDYRALRYGDTARDDIRVNDGRGAHFEFVFDYEFSRNTPRDDGSLRVNLTFPLRRRRHAQRATDTSITADCSAHDQRAASLDITGKAGALCHEGGRDAELIDQPAFRCITHRQSLT